MLSIEAASDLAQSLASNLAAAVENPGARPLAEATKTVAALSKQLRVLAIPQWTSLKILGQRLANSMQATNMSRSTAPADQTAAAWAVRSCASIREAVRHGRGLPRRVNLEPAAASAVREAVNLARKALFDPSVQGSTWEFMLAQLEPHCDSFDDVRVLYALLAQAAPGILQRDVNQLRKDRQHELDASIRDGTALLLLEPCPDGAERAIDALAAEQMELAMELLLKIDQPRARPAAQRSIDSLAAAIGVSTELHQMEMQLASAVARCGGCAALTADPAARSEEQGKFLQSCDQLLQGLLSSQVGPEAALSQLHQLAARVHSCRDSHSAQQLVARSLGIVVLLWMHAPLEIAQAADDAFQSLRTKLLGSLRQLSDKQKTQSERARGNASTKWQRGCILGNTDDKSVTPKHSAPRVMIDSVHTHLQNSRFTGCALWSCAAVALALQAMLHDRPGTDGLAAAMAALWELVDLVPAAEHTQGVLSIVQPAKDTAAQLEAAAAQASQIAQSALVSAASLASTDVQPVLHRALAVLAQVGNQHTSELLAVHINEVAWLVQHSHCSASALDAIDCLLAVNRSKLAVSCSSEFQNECRSLSSSVEGSQSALSKRLHGLAEVWSLGVPLEVQQRLADWMMQFVPSAAVATGKLAALASLLSDSQSWEAEEKAWREMTKSRRRALEVVHQLPQSSCTRPDELLRIRALHRPDSTLDSPELRVSIANLSDHLEEPSLRQQCTDTAVDLEASTHSLHLAQAQLFPLLVHQIVRQLQMNSLELSRAAQLLATNPSPVQVVQQAQEHLEAGKAVDVGAGLHSLGEWAAAVAPASPGDASIVASIEQLAKASLVLLERLVDIKAMLALREQLLSAKKVAQMLRSGGSPTQLGITVCTIEALLEASLINPAVVDSNMNTMLSIIRKLETETPTSEGGMNSCILPLLAQLHALGLSIQQLIAVPLSSPQPTVDSPETDLLARLFREADKNKDGVLDRTEFEAAFGGLSELAAQERSRSASPGSGLYGFGGMDDARNHILAAIQMGYEVVEQLASQQLFEEVAELKHMISKLEHPLQGHLTQSELEQVIMEAQNLVSRLLSTPSPRLGLQ